MDYQKFLQVCQAEGKSSHQRLERPLRTKRNSGNVFSSHEHSQNTLKLQSPSTEGSTVRELSFEFKAGWSVWISMVKKRGRITCSCLVKKKKKQKALHTVENKCRKGISWNEDELSPCSQISAWCTSSERFPILIFLLFFLTVCGSGYLDWQRAGPA